MWLCFLHITANRDENLSLVIVSIDCGEEESDAKIAVHKIPAIHKGENPSILKEFQGKQNQS